MTTQMPCPWTGCSCDHKSCVAGWLDTDEATAPCPRCRPEVAAHLRRPVSPSSSRRTLPVLERPSREAAAGLGDDRRWAS